MDERLYAPSTARNKEPVYGVLAPLLPVSGLVLEIASGAGEHITGLAERRGDLTFQPSDPDETARRSINAWRDTLGLENMRDALDIDASASTWPLDAADLVFSINMIHISPWAAAVGLFEGAARLLPAGAILYTYGPYKRDGRHTSEGNIEFDASLRQRDPTWGIRDVAELTALAERSGFSAPDVVEMPANNLSLVFRRTPAR